METPPVKVFQRYLQGGWKETTIDQIKKDYGVEPKIRDGNFYYVEMIGRDYSITNEGLRCIFFDHTSKTFLYLKYGNQQIPEDSVFSTEDEALGAIRDVEKENEGKEYVYDIKTGRILKEF